MFKKFLLLIISATFSLTIFNACENSTNPPAPTKSLRDYTWTIDTLNIPGAFQNLMYSMYAANAEDIYLVGHHTGAGVPDGAMWHYDGEEWSVVELREKLGGFRVRSIHGSSSNNVWAVGSKHWSNEDFNRSFIIQYDGVNWKEHLAKSPNGVFDAPLSKNTVYSVFAESETNVWACGAGGLVYHYDGSTWNIDTLKIDVANNEIFGTNAIIKFNSDIFVLGYKFKDSNFYGTHYLFKKSAGSWAIEDSIVENVQGGTIWKWGADHLSLSNSNQLYSCGFGGAFKLVGNSWEHIFENVSPVAAIDVKTDNDILIVGDFSLVTHYDGNNWNKFTNLEFNDVVYGGVWRDENQAFIIGRLLGDFPQKTIVIHGK